MLFVGRRTTDMGGPIFNQPVEGVDDGYKHYGVRGRSNRAGGTGVVGRSYSMGVDGRSDSGYGVFGYSISGIGVDGIGISGYGVVGSSISGYGVSGASYSGTGVDGRSDSFIGVSGRSDSFIGVSGDSPSSIGVYGSSISGIGVYGRSYSFIGVSGSSYGVSGVFGYSDLSYGVSGYSKSGDGMYGRSDSDLGSGVFGYSSKSGYGVYGRSDRHTGVFGIGYLTGVRGESDSRDGVYGTSSSGHGVSGASYSGTGVFGYSATGYAAYLAGRVYISGTLTKPGGSFKIDHPLDPANKYLSHSFVESPDMKNVYDGVVVLDEKGEAEIELPDWFAALNKDFRYQLTAIGAAGPNLYIAEEISDGVTNYSNSRSSNKNKNNNSRFKVAGGTSGMKVSWQVTGIRQDPWANANRIQVEEDKPAEERGYYIYPDLYGQAAEKGISRLLFPTEEEEERKKQEQLLINENK
jgi:hypothetical protein